MVFNNHSIAGIWNSSMTISEGSFCFLHSIFKVSCYSNLMNVFRVLLFLIVISLILQNTCPYGYAAKTAFHAPQKHDCPLKKSHHGSAKDGDSVDDNQEKAMYPSFVFSVPESHAVISCLQRETEYVALSFDNYRDPFREPLLRPPVA